MNGVVEEAGNNATPSHAFVNVKEINLHSRNTS
jgi:hypothetical protein